MSASLIAPSSSSELRTAPARISGERTASSAISGERTASARTCRAPTLSRVSVTAAVAVPASATFPRYASRDRRDHAAAIHADAATSAASTIAP